VLKVEREWLIHGISEVEGKPPFIENPDETFVATRRIAVSTETVDHLNWSGPAQIARRERRRETRRRQSVESAYLITRLTLEEAGPARLMNLARNHWAIENRLHHVRHVGFNEDRCRIRRRGTAPRNRPHQASSDLRSTRKLPRRQKNRHRRRHRNLSLNDPA